VLYGLDANTYYLVVLDVQAEAREYTRLLPESPNVRLISREDILREEELAVPRTATMAVLVTTGGVRLENAKIPLGPHRYYGVELKKDSRMGGVVTFYERGDARLTPIRAVRYGSPALGAGALVSGKPDTYACAQYAFVKRARLLTRVYEERAADLTEELSGTCRQEFEKARAILQAANAQPDDDLYMQALFQEERGLISSQMALIDSSCPVIA